MNGGSKDEVTAALRAALARLLIPLVRILIRYGVTYGAFADIAKRVYVRVASEDFRIAGRKQSASRVALLTGLPRKEVARVKTGVREAHARGERHSRIARVISGWRHDKRFLDSRGRPAALPIEDGAASFATLVRRYGADVPARATLDELLRMHAVEKLKDGRVRLLAQNYVPADLEIDKFGILGADVADLVSTIDHNLVAEPADSFLQRKVTYDNVPEDAAPKLRKIVAAYAEKLTTRVDALLAKHDRDINPNVKGRGRKRLVLGVWYFGEDHPQESPRKHGEPPEE